MVFLPVLGIGAWFQTHCAGPRSWSLSRVFLGSNKLVHWSISSLREFTTKWTDTVALRKCPLLSPLRCIRQKHAKRCSWGNNVCVISFGKIRALWKVRLLKKGERRKQDDCTLYFPSLDVFESKMRCHDYGGQGREHKQAGAGQGGEQVRLYKAARTQAADPEASLQIEKCQLISKRM